VYLKYVGQPKSCIVSQSIPCHSDLEDILHMYNSQQARRRIGLNIEPVFVFESLVQLFQYVDNVKANCRNVSCFYAC